MLPRRDPAFATAVSEILGAIDPLTLAAELARHGPEASASDIAGVPPLALGTGETVEEALIRLDADGRLRTVVLCDGRLAGVVSRADLVRIGFRDVRQSVPRPAVENNPTRAALLGPHAHLAERRGRVLRNPTDVSPFLTFPEDPADEDWRDLADLPGPGGIAGVSGVTPPPGWEVVFSGAGVQMIDDGILAAHDPEAIVLSPTAIPEMLTLFEGTRPGPFRPRTIEMGTYLGIRRQGQLVAMAGERLHPPGWTEISAVCTDAEHRGQGLAPPGEGAAPPPGTTAHRSVDHPAGGLPGQVSSGADLTLSQAPPVEPRALRGPRQDASQGRRPRVYRTSCLKRSVSISRAAAVIR